MRAKNEAKFLAEAYKTKLILERVVDGTLMCPEACCGSPVMECKCGPDCPHCNCHEIQKLAKKEEDNEVKFPNSEWGNRIKSAYESQKQEDKEDRAKRRREEELRKELNDDVLTYVKGRDHGIYKKNEDQERPVNPPEARDWTEEDPSAYDPDEDRPESPPDEPLTPEQLAEIEAERNKPRPEVKESEDKRGNSVYHVEDLNGKVVFGPASYHDAHMWYITNLRELWEDKPDYVYGPEWKRPKARSEDNEIHLRGTGFAAKPPPVDEEVEDQEQVRTGNTTNDRFRRLRP